KMCPFSLATFSVLVATSRKIARLQEIQKRAQRCPSSVVEEFAVGEAHAARGERPSCAAQYGHLGALGIDLEHIDAIDLLVAAKRIERKLRHRYGRRVVISKDRALARVLVEKEANRPIGLAQRDLVEREPCRLTRQTSQGSRVIGVWLKCRDGCERELR